MIWFVVLGVLKESSVFTFRVKGSNKIDTEDKTLRHSGNHSAKDTRPSAGRPESLSTRQYCCYSTAISMEETVTQEQIYENLRLHKEVLSSVKQQPWGMRRKLRLVQLAKAYVKRHEGALQERLAQSKTTRDILASCNIILIKVISSEVCVSTVDIT